MFHVAFGHQIKKFFNATKSGSRVIDVSSSLRGSFIPETNLTFKYRDGLFEKLGTLKIELALAS